MKSPVGGVGFNVIAQSVADWHQRSLTISQEAEIPILGLFKERGEGAGHSYGTAAVRGFVDLTEEEVKLGNENPEDADPLRLMTLNNLQDAFDIDEQGYVNNSFDKLTDAQINAFEMTPGFRKFSRDMRQEREKRPAALRDVLAFPADITFMDEPEDIRREMMRFNRAGNNDFVIRGLDARQVSGGHYALKLTGPRAQELSRLDALAQSLVDRFANDISGHWIETGELHVETSGTALDYVSRLRPAPLSIPLEEVQPAVRNYANTCFWRYEPWGFGCIGP